jgi:hypothetical protein
MLPEARVVAIDAGSDLNSLMGIELTNRIADSAQLNAHAVKGVSPEDVGPIVDAELGGTIDFAFVDGLHRNEQIVLDFEASRSRQLTTSVYLFHDVEEFKLFDGIAEIERLSGWTARLLKATPSGMALLCDWDQHPELEASVRPFMPSDDAIALIESVAQDWYLNRRVTREQLVELRAWLGQKGFEVRKSPFRQS